ncbi:MAG: response regulator [Desulfobulbaceae bacterium]|nr:response regulator [Desulfobulbaceae bacterium]HIJ78042.1 response regulator [Deltaproteobacteria bacterium]
MAIKGKILVVDDEPIVLKLLSMLVERLDYEVYTATNGPDALKSLQQTPVDLLITDIIMPGMNGIALMREALKVQPDLECIVVSGHTEISTAVEAMKMGAINYLQKPVSLIELEVSLAKGMERKTLLQDLKKNQLALQQAAQELSEETNKNKMILEAAGEGIVGLDNQGKVTLMNPAAMQMLLIKEEEEVIGKPFSTVIEPKADPQSSAECNIPAVWIFDEPMAATTTFFRANDEAFHVEYVISPINNNQKIAGAVLVFTDITKRKHIEQELNNYRQHLEKLVEERTKELERTNKQLQEDIRARKKAEKEAEQRRQQLIEADKMVSLGILVAGVAHEINNPNNFITMNAPLLHRAWEDFQPILEQHFQDHGDFLVSGIPYSEMREHIPELFSGILEGSKRIRKIVLNLRDYARQGISDMNQLFNVNDVIRAALVLLANPVKRSTDHLTVQYEENLPQVKGNFQRAEQVIINLIQNACQSLPSPDKSITITTSYNQEKKQVSVTIIDQGSGISPKHLKRIQDPFFTTKRDNGGSGLGLSISAGIMEEHNGRLEFISLPKEGTSARAIFPAAT